MSDIDELKPCPFCGSNEITTTEDWGFFFCICMNCKGRARWTRTREEAAQEWDRRAQLGYVFAKARIEIVERLQYDYRLGHYGYSRDIPDICGVVLQLTAELEKARKIIDVYEGLLDNCQMRSADGQLKEILTEDLK